jgi:hypothetical protein
MMGASANIGKEAAFVFPRRSSGDHSSHNDEQGRCCRQTMGWSTDRSGCSMGTIEPIPVPANDLNDFVKVNSSGLWPGLLKEFK